MKAQLLWVVTLSVGKCSSYQASGQAMLDCFGLLNSDSEDVDLWNLHHYQSCFLSSHFSQNVEGILKMNRLLTILSKNAGQEGLCHSAHTEF